MMSIQIPRSTLEQWRVLQAVVDEGGFAQAAESLNRSQSSVSYTVSKLQEQLSVPLLRLEGRKAVLTDVGSVLLRRARQLIEESLTLERLAGSLAQGWEPELQLVVDAAFPTHLLIKTLKLFAPLSRGCRIQLKEEVLSGADEALLSGEVDLVISQRVPPGFLGDPLITIEFVAVAHPEHPLHQLGRALTPEDLKRHLQVVVRDSGRRFKRDAGWLGAEHRWTVSSAETSVTTLVNGIGFAWLPCHRATEGLASGKLKVLPLREGRLRKELLSLTFGKSEDAGPATRELARLFRDVVGNAKAEINPDFSVHATDP